MIDLASETLLTIEQAAAKLAVTKATVHRWITTGCKGTSLEAAKLGGRWRTSEEAIQRFSDRLTPKARASQPTAEPDSFPTRTLTREQRRRHEEAERQLDEWFGIKRCEACRVEIQAKPGMIPKDERVWCPKCLVQRKSATIGQRIRTFRWAANLSQTEIARKAGFGADKLRAYERDDMTPPEPHLTKLAEVLGADLLANLEGRDMQPTG